MSRGQQGIGISAAGMYGLLTTGKPVKIISKVSQAQAGPLLRNPDRHQAEPSRDPQRRRRRGGDSSRRSGSQVHRETWDRVDRPGPRHPGDDRAGSQVSARPRQRRRISGADGHRQPARQRCITTIPTARSRSTTRSTEELPPEPKEIKPHPYGIELGHAGDDAQGHQGRHALAVSHHVVLPGQPERGAADLRDGQDEHPGEPAQDRPRPRPTSSIKAIRPTKIGPPATDCISPIGEPQLLKGLHHVVPGEFYVAATRPPAVYRGNPFQIEVALAYGGTQAANKVPLETLAELLSESDARTLRQFLTTTFLRPGRRRGRQDSQGGRAGQPGLARQAEAGRNRQAARGPAQRQSRRRADDDRAALCQPRAAAIPARAPAPSRKW